ncbi:MAG: type II secretion system protein [Pseudomonadota bacterium]
MKRYNMPRHTNGFIYLWALFAVTLAGILMAAIGQSWQIKSQREKESELLFIGEQFRKAIVSYHSSSPGTAKQYPDSLEKLVLDTRTTTTKRHLRKIYLDPMTNSIEWGLVKEPAPQQQGPGTTSSANNGIIGVHSLSDKPPIKKGGFPEQFAKFSEASTYKDWKFVHAQSNSNQSPGQSQTKPNSASPASTSPFSTPSATKPNQETPPTSPFSSPASNTPGASGFPSPK